MNFKKIFKTLEANKYILIGAWIGLLFWVVESAIMAEVLGIGDLRTQIFRPTPHEIWQRTLVFFLNVGAGTHFQIIFNKQLKIEKLLQESEERYRFLVEMSPDAIGVQQGEKIVFFNTMGAFLFGAASPSQLMGRSVSELVLPESQEIIGERFRQLREGEQDLPPIEARFKRLDGRHIDMEVVAAPLMYQGDHAVQAIFRDITQRKQAEERLRQRNRELAALNAVTTSISRSRNLGQILHDTLDEVVQLDFLGEGAKGMVFLTKPPSDEMTLAASRGARFDHPCVENPPKVGECLCGIAAETGKIVHHDFDGQNGKHSRHWTGARHQDICLPLKVRGQVLGVMNLRLPPDKKIGEIETAVLTAVSDQIAIAIENAQLSEQKDRAIQTERERIGRDLHDGLAQVLGYINTKTKATQIMLAQGKTDIANQYLKQLEKTASDISLDVREAILGLRMTGQAGEGLNASLREMIRRFSQLSNLLIHLNVADEVDSLPLTPETEIQLLGITQEALSNVRKHAQATRAWVSLLLHGDNLALTIADDGIGFDVDKIEQKEIISFGLTNMRERAEMIGGIFALEVEAGVGTRVQVRLPQAAKVHT